MRIYTSRYSNPVLKSGEYTAVRISIGTPKWNLGYQLSELTELMPFGLLGKYDDYDKFKDVYFNKLDRIGVERIWNKLNAFSELGKDVVLLCYEDIRKGKENWCHRTAFAEWWKQRTGEIIEELPEQNAKKSLKNKATGSTRSFLDEDKYTQMTFKDFI